MNQCIWTPQSWKSYKGQQLPIYENQEQLDGILKQITKVDLLPYEDIQKVRYQLNSEQLILQIGDCAEPFSECNAQNLTEKSEFYKRMGLILNAMVIGRLCGQWAKPRSQLYDDTGLINYRGDLINGYSREDRQCDPQRMLKATDLVKEGLQHVTDIILSHECLHLEYESQFVKINDAGEYYLSNTHIPWLGERTRSSNEAHAQFLSGIRNPVGVKVGPSMTELEFDRLIKLLNPNNEEGKLFIITRFGKNNIQSLTKLIQWKKQYKFDWICDPMHGNTINLGQYKTRNVKHICDEIQSFVTLLKNYGEKPRGLHLEATPYDVSECIDSETGEIDPTRYTTLCDPRLNPRQTSTVLSYFKEILQQ